MARRRRRQSQRGELTSQISSRGTFISYGRPVTGERNHAVRGRNLYRNASRIFRNIAIIGAGLRLILDLAGEVSWAITPTNKNEDFADRTRQALFGDMITPWRNIIRRAVLFQYYGFHLAEIVWQMKDGNYTFKQLSPIAQSTIEKFEYDDPRIPNELIGFTQRPAHGWGEIFIPRSKTLYIVDDALSDSPAGLGLARQAIPIGLQLEVLEMAEYRILKDSRSHLIGRVPFGLMQEEIDNNPKFTQADADALEAPLKTFVKNYANGIERAQSLTLPSDRYASIDRINDENRPSREKQWDIEELAITAPMLPELLKVIERKTYTLAALLNVEQLLVGTGTGSYALARDKSKSTHRSVNSSLAQIAEAIKIDMMEPLFILNNWPLDKMPILEFEPINERDMKETNEILIAQLAGGAINAEDPSFRDVRSRIGVPLEEEK